MLWEKRPCSLISPKKGQKKTLFSVYIYLKAKNTPNSVVRLSLYKLTLSTPSADSIINYLKQCKKKKFIIEYSLQT